jgi:hypothetical protein
MPNDGKPLPRGCLIQDLLPDLGAQGWELVTVAAESEYGTQSLDGHTSTGTGFNAGASLSGAALNGVTSYEEWVLSDLNSDFKYQVPSRRLGLIAISCAALSSSPEGATGYGGPRRSLHKGPTATHVPIHIGRRQLGQCGPGFNNLSRTAPYSCKA